MQVLQPVESKDCGPDGPSPTPSTADQDKATAAAGTPAAKDGGAADKETPTSAGSAAAAAGSSAGDAGKSAAAPQYQAMSDVAPQPPTATGIQL